MATEEEIADQAAGDIMDCVQERRAIHRSDLAKHVLGAIRLAKKEMNPYANAAYLGFAARHKRAAAPEAEPETPCNWNGA